MNIFHDFALILLPEVAEDNLEVYLGMQMTKYDRPLIIHDHAFEIMRISVLWTESYRIDSS